MNLHLKMLTIAAFVMAGITALSASSAVKPEHEVTVKIYAKNLNGRTLRCKRSYNGVFGPGYVNQSLDADSTVSISLPSDTGLERIDILASDPSNVLPSVYRSLPLLPGLTEITVDPSAENTVTVVPPTGRSVDGQVSAELYDLYNLFMSFASAGKSPGKLGLNTDSVPSEFTRKIEAYTDSLLTPFADANPVLLESLRHNARLYELMIFLVKYNRDYFDSPQWKAELTRLRNEVNLSQPSTALFSYLNFFMECLLNADKHDEIIAIPGDSLLNAQVSYYLSVLDGKAAEAAVGNVLLENGTRGIFSPDAPALTERFKEKFPNSGLIPFLDEQTARNIAFNNPPEREGIIFRDNSDIATLADILAPYKGEPVLIDLWATWCQPCLKSFTHVEPIQKYAADNGIRLLYISIDEDSDIEKKWRKLVSLNNLIGDHIMINPAVKDEIYSVFGGKGLLTIPQQAYVAPDGTITIIPGHITENEDFAPLREELEKLKQ